MDASGVSVYSFNDVEQAGEVMCAAALGQIHKQLSSLFSDGQIPIFSYPAELRDHDGFNQLVLENMEQRKVEVEKFYMTCYDLFIFNR